MLPNCRGNTLVQLMLSLMWKNVIVLRDSMPDQAFINALETNGVYIIDYDIQLATDTDILQILNGFHKRSRLNFLLLCNYTTTLKILTQIQVHDDQKSSVDLRHSARLLVVNFGNKIDWNGFRHTEVENIAVTDIHKCSPSNSWVNGHFSKVRTLMFHPNGQRSFQEVPTETCQSLNRNDVFPNIKYKFNGRQLTVVMKRYVFEEGSVIIGNRTLSGLAYPILENLAKALNFSYEIIPPREDEWGRNLQGNWTGVIGMMQRKEADLVPELLTIHKDRQEAMDYILPPVMENKLMVLYKRRDTEQDNLHVFLKPFQHEIFICLLGIFLVHSLVLFTYRCMNLYIKHPVQGLHFKDKRRNAERLDIFIGSVFECFGAALKQGTKCSAVHDSERLLQATWWFFIILISAQYCSTIMASLTVKKEQPPFTNLAELAASTEYKAGYDPSAIVGNHLQNSRQPDVVAVRQKVLQLSQADSDVLTSNTSRHLEKIHHENYAFLTGLIPSLYMTQANCKWEALDSKFGSAYFAFAAPKDSPFMEDFQRSMYMLRDGGILSKVTDQWLESIPESRCPPDTLPKPITLTQIQSIFYAGVAGLMFSVLTLILEALLEYRLQRQSN